MRVFLCAFCGFSVAIPMDHVSSIMIYTDSEQGAVRRNPENRNTYISLPALLNNTQGARDGVRHGVVIKNGEDSGDILENKVILLTTEIERETEIPGEQIYPLPEIFACFRFSRFFNGIFFMQSCPVLLLNAAQIAANIQKELL